MNSINHQSSQPFSTIKHQRHVGESRFGAETCLHRLRVAVCAIALAHAIGLARPAGKRHYVALVKLRTLVFSGILYNLQGINNR